MKLLKRIFYNVVIQLGKLILKSKNLYEYKDENNNIIISNCHNPTVFYYFSKNSQTIFYEKETPTDIHNKLKKKISITIVRGINLKTFFILARNLKKIKSINIFVDDALHIFYRECKIGNYGIESSYKFFLAILLSLFKKLAILTSTKNLSKEFGENKVQVISPRDKYTYEKKTFFYFYHGTSIHLEEIDFILKVVCAVQKELRNAQFEIIGNREIQKRFKHIPRVRILYPMPWENFYAYTQACTLDVGLAPLMNTKINKYRSETKFFDIHRCNAVGIFSKCAAYKIIEDYHAGITINNCTDEWIYTIEMLYSNTALRKAIFRNGNKIKFGAQNELSH